MCAFVPNPVGPDYRGHNRWYEPRGERELVMIRKALNSVLFWAVVCTTIHVVLTATLWLGTALSLQ